MDLLLASLGFAALITALLAVFALVRHFFGRAFGIPVGRFRVLDQPIIHENAVSPWARPAIFVAGAAASYLLAASLFGVSYIIGGEERPGGTTIRVIADKPAAQAGMWSGDRIVAVAGVRVDCLEAISAAVAPHAGEPIDIVVDRNGSELHLTVTPTAGADRKGRIGIATVPVRVPIPVFEAILRGVRLPALVLVSIAKGMWTSLVYSPGSEVAGPVGIVRATSLQHEDRTANLLYGWGVASMLFWPRFVILSLYFLPARRKKPLPAEDRGAKRP